MKFLGAVLIALLALAAPALAQSPQTVKLCIPTSGTACPPVTASAPLPVTGSFSSTISGFTPGLTYASLTAAGTSGSVALPAGVVVAFQNTGTTTVSCTLGVGSATATAGMVQVPPSSTIFLTVGSNTFGACIDESGSVSNVVRLSGGAGLGTGFGGDGGSGGGGAVTVADGSDVAEGAVADAAASVGGTGTLSAKLRRMTTQLDAIQTGVGAAVPACATTPCTTTIGDVGIDVSSGKGTPSSIPINISTGTTTQLIAASGATVIYVTSWDVIAGGTGNITLQSADTGGACANPVALTGAYPLTAQAGIAKGSGVGAVLKLPSGKALCALTSAAVQMSGSVSYQQF